jgi:hypothetical protein
VEVKSGLLAEPEAPVSLAEEITSSSAILLPSGWGHAATLADMRYSWV